MNKQAQLDMLLNKLTTQKKDAPGVLTRILELEKKVQAMSNLEKIISGKNGMDGRTPVKGVDYFTVEEISVLIEEIIKEVTPEKGVHYFDGEDGENGVTPVKGKDYFTEEEIKAVAEMVRSDSIVTKEEFDSFVKSQQQEEVVEEKETNNLDANTILAALSAMSPADAVKFSKKLGAMIDISHIRNAQSFMFNGKKYKIEELMHGGASSSGTAVYNEVVAGSGTSWTLAHIPTTGTLQLYANGQRLMETTDYTLSGASITTLTSWAAGTLLADYLYSA